MDFKLWLESEETHPFEKWHKDYTDALEREKKMRRGNQFMGVQPRPTGPGNSDELRKQQERNSIYVVRVIHIDAYTSGLHGYGDQQDVPASDPFDGAEPEIGIDAKTERRLVGRTAFICDKSGGSFHERWGKLDAYVIVNDIVDIDYYHDDTPKEDQLEYERFSPNDYRHIVKFFKFQSVKQTAEIMEEIEPHISFPVQPDEDREAYWQRVMRSVGNETPPDPSGYNPRDDYYRK